MGRKLRLEYAGACYHVINRGNYRRALFRTEGAADSFVGCLMEAERFGWRLHAYVVMSNHFHLAVETPEPNLSEGMRWLQATWAMRFNRFRGEVGRPFQGRYKALHVEPGHALAQVAHYIHLNPVRAKVMRVERLLDYRWSSLGRFVAKNRPQCLVPETVLAESGGLKDTAAGWKSYVAYLEVLAEEDARQRDKKFGWMSRGWLVGSANFKAGIKKEFAEMAQGATGRFEVAGADRAAHGELRAQLWEDRLQACARAFGLKLGQLPDRKSAPAKVDVAAAMKAICSVSNGWLAERLKMGAAASVSQFVRRHRLSGRADSREFKTSLSRVKP